MSVCLYSTLFVLLIHSAVSCKFGFNESSLHNKDSEGGSLRVGVEYYCRLTHKTEK